MNGHLKELADQCGIQKTLTFHCGRNTFATTITLTNGAPIETAGKMLGDKSLRTTQQYAKILDLKVSDDMLKLRSSIMHLQNRIRQTKNKLNQNGSRLLQRAF